MIAWLIGFITFILVLFIFWRARSAAFRQRCEEPKYRFLEQLGIPSHQDAPPKTNQNPQGGYK